MRREIEKVRPWLVSALLLVSFAGIAWGASKVWKADGGVQFVCQSGWLGATGTSGVYCKTGVGLRVHNTDNTEFTVPTSGSGAATTPALSYAGGVSNADETELITSALGAHTMKANASGIGDLFLIEDSAGNKIVDIPDNSRITLNSDVPNSGALSRALVINSLNDLITSSVGPTWGLELRNHNSVLASISATLDPDTSQEINVWTWQDAHGGAGNLGFWQAGYDQSTLAGFDQSGTNAAAPPLLLRGGLATGNAASGDVCLEYGPPGSSGTTLQTETVAYCVDGSTGLMYQTVTADGTVTAGLAVKPSPTTDHRYIVAGTSDSSQLIVGIALSGAANSGNTFKLAFSYGQERTVLSDGAGTITRGQVLSLSSATAGEFAQGTSNPYCVATSSAAATPGAAVTCRSIESGGGGGGSSTGNWTFSSNDADRNASGVLTLGAGGHATALQSSIFVSYNGSTSSVPSISWTTPTLLNSYVAYGAPFDNPGYYKDATGVVHVRGCAKSGTAGGTVFTFAAGYRPTNEKMVSGLVDSSVQQIIVLSTGDIKAQVVGGNAAICFDGITFLAEQ